VKQYEVSISEEAEEHLFELWLYLEERFGNRAADSLVTVLDIRYAGWDRESLR
jgi:hypothetical protein